MKLLIRELQKAGLDTNKYSVHKLRHTALTHWKEIGIDLSAIQYLAGHVEGSDITEGVYIETSLDFVKQQVAKIS